MQMRINLLHLYYFVFRVLQVEGLPQGLASLGDAPDLLKYNLVQQTYGWRLWMSNDSAIE